MRNKDYGLLRPPCSKSVCMAFAENVINIIILCLKNELRQITLIRSSDQKPIDIAEFFNIFYIFCVYVSLLSL